MSKVIVTLKEPIKSDGDMKTILEFDHVQSWDNKEVLYFSNVGEKSDCPVPIHNILGVSYKKEDKS